MKYFGLTSSLRVATPLMVYVTFSQKFSSLATLWQGIKRITCFLTLATQREKCPEVIKTYNNRCANLILCNTCMIIIYNNIIQN
jgi:hypothetical protein